MAALPFALTFLSPNLLISCTDPGRALLIPLFCPLHPHPPLPQSESGSAWLHHAQPPAAELASVIELIQPQGLHRATRRKASVWSEWGI